MSSDNFYMSIPDSNDIAHKMRVICAEDEVCTVDTFGYSLLGKPLQKVQFGNPDKQVLIVGGFHALENITTVCLFYFIDELINSLKQNTPFVKVDLNSCLDDVGVTIIPCLNPDGVDISLYGETCAGKYSSLVKPLLSKKGRNWQANARGVDLNHNFDAGYQTLKKMEEKQGIFGPAPTQYGGQYAHSEPEVKALVDLVECNNFTKVYAIHSQGEEIMYEYGSSTPAQSRLIAEILSKASDYQIVKQGDLASHGGFKDWFIEKHKKPGFTIELGKGKNPLPIEDCFPTYEKIRQMLSLTLIL